MANATIVRSGLTGRYYASFGQTRSRRDYATPQNAKRAAEAQGHTVTIDPGCDPTLVSVAHMCKFFQLRGQQALVIRLDKYGKDQEAIEFRGADAVKTANEFLPKMGFKKVRLTSNMLNPSAGTIVIDEDTPSCCDVGSEAYHSM